MAAGAKPEFDEKRAVAATPWRAFGKLFALSLAVRLIFNRLFVYPTSGGDMDFYLTAASNILHHGTFSRSTQAPFEPTTYRGPFFSAFVAAIEKLTGESLSHVQIVQCLLSSIAVVVFARAISTFSLRAGVFVGFAMALSPFDAVYASSYLSESLVTFFLVIGTSILFLVQSRWRWVASGIVFGLAALTRDVYMLFFPTMAVFAVIAKTFDSRALRHRVLGPLVLVLAGVCTIAPWTVRNYSVTGHVIPISRSVLARALWFGTWVKDDEHVRNDPTGKHLAVPGWAFHLPGEKEKFDSWKLSTDEAERDRVFAQMFRDRFKAEPATVIAAWFRRAPKIWIASSRLDLWDFRPSFLARGKLAYVAVKSAVYFLNIAMFLGAIAGTLLSIRRWARPWLFFAVPLVYTVGVFLPLDGLEPRYTEPVVPFMIVMVAYLLEGERARAWTEKLASKLRRKPIGA